jgi:hypothetical protein
LSSRRRRDLPDIGVTGVVSQPLDFLGRRLRCPEDPSFVGMTRKPDQEMCSAPRGRESSDHSPHSKDFCGVPPARLE